MTRRSNRRNKRKRAAASQYSNCQDWIKDSKRAVETIMDKAKRGKWHPTTVAGDLEAEIEIVGTQCFKFGARGKKGKTAPF